jgi:putative membrane protein
MSNSSSDFSFRKLLNGAVAGFVATAPMSVSMLTGWMLLPKKEKYPLPPRLITEEITEKLGLEDRMSENEMVGLTIFSHFGYGALFGSLYALFDEKMPLHSSLKGGLAGLALWAGSYLGWLPALGILRSAAQHPWRRNLLMIIAHLVWGVTLGEVTRKLNAQE